MSRIMVVIGIAVVAFAVAACGGTSGGGYGGGGGSTASSSSGKGSVALASTKLGKVLVDGNGRTLYLFEADKTTKSTCYGACAGIWPPLTAAGAPKAGPHVVGSELGTTKRTDGTTEVTYHGHPLYYYAGDAQPGDTTGQALDQFGAEWYVLAPSGSKIDKGS
jgi:predicted lipoprotein with Yx(FWY)xxD motif